MQWISHYLYGAQFALIAVSAVIFFMDKRLSRFFHQVRLQPRHALLFLFVTFLFALGRQYLYEEIRTIGYAQRIWGQLYDVFFYFRFSFPFLFCLSLVLLYWRYGRKLSFLPRKNGGRELQRGENEADWSADIDRWCNRSEWNSAGRFSDRQELKGRMLQLMTDLKAMDLTGGEAFGIAVKRLGSGHFEWKVGNSEADDHAIEIKKSLLIMAGVPIYFLLYYFLGATSKLLFILLCLAAGWKPQFSLIWVSGYLKLTCFICIIFFMSLYFFEKKTILFIGNLEIKNKTVFSIFLAAIVFGVLDTYFLPICKNLMEPNAPVRMYFYQIFRNFDHAFPLIASFTFITLYLRYYRKTTI